ncbi:hypothetical protein [Allohahella marinimesophila]|uniref:Uncharacterized protein n=1 Tax=Allohahella marinimesophila TaxID=1054972 RepID=A0ABP7Q6W3_9GAMM
MTSLDSKMIVETTLKLPNGLLLRAQKYAEKQGTTITALIREHLVNIVEAEQDALLFFSLGKLSKEKAIEALGLRDYAQLLVLMGESDLPLPKRPSDNLDQQVEIFEQLWLMR